ncbi:conjugal transfer protein TraO, partial [Escherichia coli]|uniref:TrbG/VirB9 family P-type conjugative transfer protein n=1 Tax=Escherichia coli TaxID=562 RepID=UPI0024A6AC1B
MKKQLIAGLILVSLGLSGQALALEVGKGSPYDYRIKSVVYNPVDVVRIDSVAGVATHIVVAPDESYVTHAFGDSNSYAFTHVENNIFIKPKGEVPSDTNLVLVTNKRTYNIVLHCVGDYTTKDAQGNVKANFIKTPW